MSRSFELDPVEVFTAGAVGEPGERTFYMQAAAAGELVTFLAEKEQVRVLAEAINRLLAQLPDGPEGDEPDDPALELAEPLLPEWRVGEMSIEFDEMTDRIVITLNEVQPAADEEDEEDDLPPPPPPIEEPGHARLVVTRAQVRAMADRALDVVAAGRPRCQFCGYPLVTGEDHVCPAMNGHGRPAT